jgi:hypothetical protein
MSAKDLSRVPQYERDQCKEVEKWARGQGISHKSLRGGDDRWQDQDLVTP